MTETLYIAATSISTIPILLRFADRRSEKAD